MHTCTLGETAGLPYNCYLSATACVIVLADQSFRYTSMLLGKLSNQPATSEITRSLHGGTVDSNKNSNDVFTDTHNTVTTFTSL